MHLQVEFGEGTSMFKFLKNVSREMKKVSWPKGKELTSYTVVVISTVVFMAVFFGLIDLGISELLNLFF
jgi:preprotein translocase subunit SecE